MSTSENSANCASRVMSAHNLKEFALWWHGPVWLNSDNIKSPQAKLFQFETELEINTQSAANSVQTEISNSIRESLEKFSSLHKVIAVLAFVLRWLRKVRKLKIGTSFLSSEEIRSAHSYLYRLVQNEYFSEDIRLIHKNLPLPHRNHLLRLNHSLMIINF